MKINNKLMTTLGILLLLNTGCSKDTDIQLTDFNTTFYNENFSSVTVDGSEFQKTGWKNFNEVGSKKWTGEFFSGNGSVAFSAFSSGDLINVGWLISPPLNMDLHEGEKLNFQSQHNFLRSRDNTLELLVSTDYDGTNVLAASWINIPIATPSPDSPRFTDVDSGIINLSKYKGKLHFAFKVKGSGTNSNLTGTYQIDDINIFYPSK
jgi:Domain of unknown function (DUF5017)